MGDDTEKTKTELSESELDEAQGGESVPFNYTKIEHEYFTQTTSKSAGRVEATWKVEEGEA
ncbi:MAG: hypothetical protein AAGE80_15565 [Pseudomonadota bacterium]